MLMFLESLFFFRNYKLAILEASISAAIGEWIHGGRYVGGGREVVFDQVQLQVGRFQFLGTLLLVSLSYFQFFILLC